MVQTFTQREVQQSGQGSGYLNVSYSPDSFGAQVGRAMQGLGQTGMNIAETQAVLDKQKKANDALTAMNTAKDKLRPTLFDPEFGVFAQQGGNAMGAGATATAALDNVKKQTLENIKDPETKTAFERMWAQESDSTKDTVARFEMNQLGSYKVETAKATLNGSMQDAYNQYNDPEAIKKAIDRAELAINVNSAGLPEEALSAAKAESRSQIHLAVISRWASEDPYKALDYYKEHKEELSGKDHVTANSFVEAARNNRFAQEWVSERTQTSGSGAAIWGALEMAESGGNPNTPDSPKGALGIAQVMPDTAREVLVQLGRQDLANLPDAELKNTLRTDTALNRRIGQTYLSTQLKTFGGDVEAALVAYNAGPAAAKAFLAHNAGKVPGSRDYDVPGFKGLKSETEKYVQKIFTTAGYSSGQTPPGYRMTVENWTLKNFKPTDLMAPTEGGQWVDARAAQGLDSIADAMSKRFPGFKVKINEETSGDPNQPTAGRRRGTSDPKDNPHVDKSQHLAGNAFDIQVQGWTDEQKAAFLQEARSRGFSGIGFYGPNGHLHIDMGKERTWGPMPEWAKAAMATPITRGAGGEVVTKDFAGATPPTGQTFVGPGNWMGQGANGYFVNASQGSLNNWLAEAQMIPDAGQRERTIAMLNLVSSAQERDTKAQKTAVESMAWDLVTKGSVKDVEKRPELLSRLEPGFVNTLYSYEANRNKGGPVTDWNAYYRTTQLSDRELAGMDMYTEMRNKAADAEFQKLITLQQEARKKLEGTQYDASLLANTRSRNDIVTDMINAQGWNNPKARQNEKIAEFNKVLDEKITGEQALKGKALTATEIQDIADKLLISDRRDGWGWDKARNAMVARESPDDFVAAKDWSEVQNDDKQRLTEVYESRFRQQPNQEAATDLYNRAMRVWIGGKPDGPDDEKKLVRQSLETQLNRQLTETEFERYYGQYLLTYIRPFRPNQ